MNPGRQRGFTLLETLIALSIAAVTAAVVLANVHGLRLRAAQERAHVLAVLHLLNGSVIMTRGSVPTTVRQSPENFLLLEPQTEGAGPVLTAHNFSLRDEKPLPPVQIAYTPLQRFRVEAREGQAGDSRFSISFIAPAVAPPKGYGPPQPRPQ